MINLNYKTDCIKYTSKRHLYRYTPGVSEKEEGVGLESNAEETEEAEPKGYEEDHNGGARASGGTHLTAR